jgi:hypothetical protein
MADDDDAQDTPGGQDDQQDNSGDTQDQQRDDATRTETDQSKDGDTQQDTKTFTQADVDRLLADRLARERKKYAGYDDFKKKASELDKLKDANKTELEKKEEQLTKQAIELQELKVEKIRRSAAKEAGLDPDLAEFITAADPDDALEQAKRLAERFKKAPADLKQGTRQTPAPQRTRDELLRGLAGFGQQR